MASEIPREALGMAEVLFERQQSLDGERARDWPDDVAVIARALRRFRAEGLREMARKIGDSAGINSFAYEKTLDAEAARYPEDGGRPIRECAPVEDPS